MLRRQRRAHRLDCLRLRALLRHVRLALSHLLQPRELVLSRLQLEVQLLEALRLLRLQPPHLLRVRYGALGGLAPLVRLALGARQLDAWPPHALVGKGGHRPVEVGGGLQQGGVPGLGSRGRRLELQLFVRVLRKLGLVSREEAQPVVRQKGVELGLLVFGGLPRLVRLRLRLENLLELRLVLRGPSARGAAASRQSLRRHGTALGAITTQPFYLSFSLF